MNTRQIKTAWRKVAAIVGMIVMGTATSSMADAVRVYDVDDYVQRGLITHFDGIRNAGADVAHDSTAVGWTNLVARQPHAEFVGDTGSWAESGLGYSFKGTGSAYAMISSPGIELGNYATIQLALDATPSENKAKYTGLFRSLGNIADELILVWQQRRSHNYYAQR